MSRLNQEWIVGHFEVKDIDEAFFRDPAAEVIAKGGEIFCALIDDAVVGCACVVPASDGSMYLTKVAVTPAAQGRGIGRRLCAAVIDLARERRAPKVTLWSNSGLRAAVRVYESLGFSHRPSPVTPPHSDADVYMERSLP
ncbi:MAG: GNAT family N-acetyltransferase [Gemmatimonadetes bacterium]|nr:GNAT family N-acetyltransferase [Gemmatimonadota bacterium]